MNITLCQNLSENNIINKSITDVDSVTAVIKGALSVENPVLILDYNSSLQNINYLKIPELHRNYYITDIINLTGSRYEIRCKTDVLESFKTAILGLNAIVDKQQSDILANMYYNDGSFVSSEKEFIYTKNFPTGFLDNGTFILITAGGIPT